MNNSFGLPTEPHHAVRVRTSMRRLAIGVATGAAVLAAQGGRLRSPNGRFSDNQFSPGRG